jgi:hypothetical protein
VEFDHAADCLSRPQIILIRGFYRTKSAKSMAWFNSETVTLLKHLIGNFVVAIVLLAAAIGLALVERLCEEWKMPPYVCNGANAIAYVMFGIDGIVFCGTAIIVSIRLLVKTWTNDN